METHGIHKGHAVPPANRPMRESRDAGAEVPTVAGTVDRIEEELTRCQMLAARIDGHISGSGECSAKETGMGGQSPLMSRLGTARLGIGHLASTLRHVAQSLGVHVGDVEP